MKKQNPKQPEKNQLSKHYKGYGLIHSSFFSKIKSDAKRRNLEFNLTIKDAWKLFLKQKGVCAISGRQINFAKTATKKADRDDRTASLDRKDSKKGYTKSNCQWLHKVVNIMKSNFSEEEFIKFCKDIAKNND